MVNRKPNPHYQELRCICGRLIGYVKQRYYIKHEYRCIECYINEVKHLFPSELELK